MDKYFVDANLVLRFLTNDIPDQAEAVEHIIRKASEEEISLQTSALVIAEIVWTLESYYELSREGIKEDVLAILNTPGLEVEDADLIAQAVLLYVEKNIDFIDAYNACWMKQNELSQVYTFDVQHFKRIEGIKPLLP